MIIYQISPSSLDAYDTCPRCWKLSKEKGKFAPSAAMHFGTRLHSAIFSYHRDGITEFSEELQPFLHEYMTEYSQEYNLGEEYWKVPLFSGIDLAVKLDLIKDDMLIEHKTSSKKYSQEFVDQHKQISAYVYAWNQKYSEPPQKIRMNVFITNPKRDENLLQILETYRDEAQMAAWETWVKNILQGIENDEFEPKPARWHNYVDCPLYVEKDE